MQQAQILPKMAESGSVAAENTLKLRDLGHGAAAATAYGSGGWGFEFSRAHFGSLLLASCPREDSHP